MALVGERGPELVSLPTGSRVFSNQDSRQMAGRANGIGLTVNITVNGDIMSEDFEERVNRSVLDALIGGGFPQLARA